MAALLSPGSTTANKKAPPHAVQPLFSATKSGVPSVPSKREIAKNTLGTAAASLRDQTSADFAKKKLEVLLMKVQKKQIQFVRSR